jgi:hypothetical protein
VIVVRTNQGSRFIPAEFRDKGAIMKAEVSMHENEKHALYTKDRSISPENYRLATPLEISIFLRDSKKHKRIKLKL